MALVEPVLVVFERHVKEHPPPVGTFLRRRPHIKAAGTDILELVKPTTSKWLRRHVFEVVAASVVIPQMVIHGRTQNTATSYIDAYEKMRETYYARFQTGAAA